MTSYTVALAVLLALGVQPGRAPAQASPTIVFVCEHGAAKSLVATAYFNKMAVERGMTERATFRGVSPDDSLAVSALEGLRADGVAIPAGKPTAIGRDDVTGATHIFAIGCVLPASAQSTGKASAWTDVPDGKGYGPMRDAIVGHVRALLDEIQRRRP